MLDKVRRRLRLKHYSLRTEQAYLYWIRRYIRANHPRHPRAMGGVEVERSLSDLARRDRVAPSTQNQALSALLFLYREVLAQDLPWMENVVRAKRAPRLPVVLSRAETLALLRNLSGREALMAGLLYGSGLRLMECLRLRVKDIDLARNGITVREGKGGKDRMTVLPERLRAALQAQLDAVRVLHARDLEAGFGTVSRPHALARKYRNAEREPGWQYVFPATRRAADPIDGREKRHHLDESVLQRAVRAAARGRDRQAGESAHLATLLRDAPAGIGGRHPYRTRVARAQGCRHHADLHARVEPWREWRPEPAGSLTYDSNPRIKLADMSNMTRASMPPSRAMRFARLRNAAPKRCGRSGSCSRGATSPRYAAARAGGAGWRHCASSSAQRARARVRCASLTWP